MEYFKTVCSNDCPAVCGLVVGVENGKVECVKGDVDHPFFHGIMCEKMQGYPKAINNANRIMTPLKRIGPKGEGKFKEISWDEAIDTIVENWQTNLEQYGPDSIMGMTSSGNQGLVHKNIVRALFNKMGARQMEMTLCSSAKAAAYDSCTGGFGSMDPMEMEFSDYVLVWGSHVKNTRIHTLPILHKLRKEGKKVVLIEVYDDNASYVDETVLITPGSDGALALAMIHVLYKEGYVDTNLMHEFMDGFDEFIQTIDQYTPAWASSITNVSEDTIIRLAHEFGKAQAPSILFGSGPTRRFNGGMNTRLVMILSAITGAWYKKGGGFVGRNPQIGACVDTKRIERPDLRTYYGKVVNATLLSKALIDPELHSFYCSGGNPVNSIHNQKDTIQGLCREDLFTVVHERNMTDTCKYADIILPATYQVEHNDCFGNFNYCTFGTAYKIVDAPKECKSNLETISLLAKAMGYEDEHFSKTDLELVHDLLEHPGIALQNINDEQKEILYKGGVIQVPKASKIHFPTKSGKFQVVDDSLECPIPCYIEDFKDEEPLSLVHIPGYIMLNSMFFDRDDLVEKHMNMYLLMHPEDAKERNIQNGDSIVAYNDLASVDFICKITDKIALHTVGIIGVHNSKTSNQLYQSNALLHARLSDIGKSTTLNGNHVNVRKK